MATVFDDEIIGAMARGIVDDMQAGLFRSGYSSIIRESHDASCAILLADGALGAQKVVLPIHVGAFPAVVSGLLNRFPPDTIQPGDCFVSNSPWEGGSPHNPDFAVVAPVFFEGELVAFTASIAHKSDIGGAVPGSCPATARDMYSEGLHIPPVRLFRDGVPNPEVVTLISGNSRSATIVMGDLMGQAGICMQGAVRVADLFARFGRTHALSSFAAGRKRTEVTIRQALEQIPDFVGSAERWMDNDGISLDRPIAIRVTVEKTGDHIHFDFTETDPQGAGPINIRPHLLNACCAYVMVAISDTAVGINQGIMDTFTVKTKLGTLVDPHFPAPVNSYNTAMHAVIESIFAAMGEVVPSLARADGGGGRALTFAHQADGKTLIQYELFAGGTGAMQGYQGQTGCHCNQTNGKVGSLEMIETEFPIRVEEFSVKRESGGLGKFRGGHGFRRRYRLLDGQAAITLRSSKHQIAPEGTVGGQAGAPGHCEVSLSGQRRVLATMESGVVIHPNDTLVIETPGGGGFG